jgi:hypothetical protein
MSVTHIASNPSSPNTGSNLNETTSDISSPRECPEWGWQQEGKTLIRKVFWLDVIFGDYLFTKIPKQRTKISI